MVNLKSFDDYVDLLIVIIGPDITGQLSLLNDSRFDLEFETRLSRVFCRFDHISWEDAFLITEKLFTVQDDGLFFLKLVKKAKLQGLQMIESTVQNLDTQELVY